MANVRNANTYHIDGTASTLAVLNIKVSHVIVTATAASAILQLQDVTTGNIKGNFRVATSGETRVFEFADNPIVFPNGINPATVTNCVATLIIQESRS